MTISAQRSQNNVEFVTFFSGGQSFGIDIANVREIRRWGPFTSVPHSPVGLLGVMNLRGSVIPIFDLAELLGLSPTPENARNVIVVVTRQEQTLGLLVESVSEIMTVSEDAIQATPDLRNDSGQQPILGLLPSDAGMTQLIDLATIIRGREAGALC